MSIEQVAWAGFWITIATFPLWIQIIFGWIGEISARIPNRIITRLIVVGISIALIGYYVMMMPL